MAYGCDSYIKFSRSKYIRNSLYEQPYIEVKNNAVFIQSGDGSKYGEDGYRITAGFFIKENKHLTIEETKSIYNARENAPVCDKCIEYMLENKEIGDGGGVNEE